MRKSVESVRRHYPSPPVDSSELFLKGLGVRESMSPGTVKRPGGASTWLFVCFLSEAFDYGPLGETRIPAGSLVIWRPFASHDFGNLLAKWNHSWLLADGSVIEKGVKEWRLPCETPLGIPAAPLFERAMLSLHAEVSGHREANVDYARNTVQNMLIDIGRLLESSTRKGQGIPEEYLEAKAYIEDSFREPLSLFDLARLAGRSPQRFSTRFKELFGVSPIEHVMQLRLAEASALLQNRKLQVKDVAAMTGFNSIHYFCRAFRKRYGVSPSGSRTLPPDSD